MEPIEIIDEVGKLPPYQRKTAEDSYRGIKVNWKLIFSSARSSVKNKIKVWAKGGQIFPHVYFEVNENDYPELKVLHKGRDIWVEGEISEVNGHSIDLKNCIIKFDDTYKDEDNKTYNIIDSQIHFGHGDNIGRDKVINNTPKKGWYEKPLGILLLSIVGGVTVGVILFYLR